MRLFSKPYEKESTDELQASLTGLVYKIVAKGYGTLSEMDNYQEIITELMRRKVKPDSYLKPERAS